VIGLALHAQPQAVNNRTQRVGAGPQTVIVFPQGWQIGRKGSWRWQPCTHGPIRDRLEYSLDAVLTQAMSRKPLFSRKR
jgi:hypothetical protein